MGRRMIDDNILLEMLKEGKRQKEIAAHFKVSPVAVCKRLKRLVPPPNLDHLTAKRKAFVVKVSQGHSPTQAAMEAFDCKDRKSAKALGSQLLAEPDINKDIKAVMDYHGLTRSYRVQRLKGHVDHPDPNISLKALDQSWRLDGYVEKHLNVGINIEALNKEALEFQKQREALEAEMIEHFGIDTKEELKEFIESTNKEISQRHSTRESGE